MDRFNLKAQKKRTDTSNDYRTMPPKRQGSISMLNMKDYKVAGKTKDKTSFSQKLNYDDTDNTETIDVQSKFENENKKEKSINHEKNLTTYKKPYDDDYKNPEIEEELFSEKDFEIEESTSPKEWSKESIEKKLKLLDRVYNSEQNTIINKQEKINKEVINKETEQQNENIKHEKINKNIKTKLDVEKSLKELERLEKEKYSSINTDIERYKNQESIIEKNEINANKYSKSIDDMDITGVDIQSYDMNLSESLTNLDDTEISQVMKQSDNMDISDGLISTSDMEQNELFANLDDMDIGKSLMSSVDININENMIPSNNLDFSEGLVSPEDLEDYQEGLLYSDDSDFSDDLLSLNDLDNKKGFSLETDELCELENLSLTDNISLIDELDSLDEIASKEVAMVKENIADKESEVLEEPIVYKEKVKPEKQILYDQNKNSSKLVNETNIENSLKNKPENRTPKFFENENITENLNFIESYCKESGYVFDEKEIDIINFLGKSESVYFRKIKIIDKNLFYINMAISRVLYLDALAMIDEKNIESAKILLEEIALCSVDTKFSNKALEKLKDLLKEENNEIKIQKIINDMFIKEKETLNLIYNLKFLVYNL